MKILAIESSCDETAAAVVEDGRKVISSVVASQVEEHKLYGGVVPEIASRRHAEAIVPVVKNSLEQAELTLKEKLLNQVKEDDETIKNVNKNNIAFAKGIMPLFFKTDI